MEPNLDFVPPEGVVFTDVDSQTGLLWNDYCNGRRLKEVFVAGTEPITECGEDRFPPAAESTPVPRYRQLSPRVRELGDTERIPAKRTKQKGFWDSIWNFGE